MNNTVTRKRITKSVGILAIGGLLTAGGLFLWQNQFDFSLFSSASNTTIQAVMVLGERPTNQQPQHAIQVVAELDKSQNKPPELIDRSENALLTSSLRDQAVLSYNDVTKPIENKVYYLVRTGRNTALNGITEKDTVTTISGKVAKEITTLIDLASARPGVFPKGFMIYIATLPDPTGGSGDVSTCNGKIPSNGSAYIKSVYEAVNGAIKETARIYPNSMRVVEVSTAFQNHGINSQDPWFSDCLTVNEKGENEIAKLFVAAVAKE
jgi:hypothetical protein